MRIPSELIKAYRERVIARQVIADARAANTMHWQGKHDSTYVEALAMLDNSDVLIGLPNSDNHGLPQPLTLGYEQSMTSSQTQQFNAANDPKLLELRAQLLEGADGSAVFAAICARVDELMANAPAVTATVEVTPLTSAVSISEEQWSQWLREAWRNYGETGLDEAFVFASGFRAAVLRFEQFSVSVSPPPVVAEPPKLVCPDCGANRLVSPCRRECSCYFIGTAQAANVVGLVPLSSVDANARALYLEFKHWAQEHLGQGYGLEEEDGKFVNNVTRWCFIGFKAGYHKGTLESKSA